MREIETEVAISATPDVVWSHLTAFEQFTDWNPFITRAEGKAEVGARLVLMIEPPGGKPMVFKPKVLVAESGRELRWLGRLLFPGIFDGEHRFVLESRAGGTRLIHAEKFRGLMVPLIWKSMRAKTTRGFELMNEALKQRCEE